MGLTEESKRLKEERAADARARAEAEQQKAELAKLALRFAEAALAEGARNLENPEPLHPDMLREAFTILAGANSQADLVGRDPSGNCTREAYKTSLSKFVKDNDHDRAHRRTYNRYHVHLALHAFITKFYALYSDKLAVSAQQSSGSNPGGFFATAVALRDRWKDRVDAVPRDWGSSHPLVDHIQIAADKNSNGITAQALTETKEWAAKVLAELDQGKSVSEALADLPRQAVTLRR